VKTGTQSLRWFPTFVGTTFWMPPYQVRGRLLKSGMTEKAVYGQTLFIPKSWGYSLNGKWKILLDKCIDIV
jgi:hypothetical protein